MRCVSSLVFAVLVVGVSTQSASAAQLTAGRVSFAGVERFVRGLFAVSPAAPSQARGSGALSRGTRAGTGSGHAPGVAPGQLAAAAPGIARPAAGRSGAVTKGFDARTSTRLAARSTVYTTWWQNTDGTLTEKISQTPVNYKDSSGTWQPIDTSLVKGADGLWHVKAAGYGLALAAGRSGVSGQAELLAKPTASGRLRASAVQSGSSTGVLATVAFASGESFGWSLAGANDVAATTSGDTVTFPSILAGTDLRLTSESSGVKESLVLSSASVANSWTFPLTLTGVSLTRAVDGTWELTDSSGAVVAVLPAPYAYDASGGGVGPGAQTSAVSYALSTVGGVQQLTMTLDSAWLHDSARVFPVTVDPSVSNPGTENSAYVSYANPTANYGTSTSLYMGYTGTDLTWSYINFPSGVANTGYHITASSFAAFMTSGSTSSSYPFSVYSVGTAWSPSTVTY